MIDINEQIDQIKKEIGSSKYPKDDFKIYEMINKYKSCSKEYAWIKYYILKNAYLNKSLNKDILSKNLSYVSSSELKRYLHGTSYFDQLKESGIELQEILINDEEDFVDETLDEEYDFDLTGIDERMVYFVRHDLMPRYFNSNRFKKTAFSNELINRFINEFKNEIEKDNQGFYQCKAIFDIYFFDNDFYKFSDINLIKNTFINSIIDDCYPDYYYLQDKANDYLYELCDDEKKRIHNNN